MAQYDPAWLEEQYNNRKRVPEHPQILESWTRASALSRERASCRIDVPYAGGPRATLDVFPTPKGNAPVLVYIHGGYWRALDKSDQSFVAPSFVADGVMVVLPNYGLAPAMPMASIAVQLTQALAWVWRNAALYGGDPSRIVVAGHSAGGHLATMLLACDWKTVSPQLPADLVKGALSLSGLYDLNPLRYPPFLRSDLQLTPSLAAKLSPALLPAPARGTLYAVVGGDESEEFMRQNGLIRQRWGAARVPVCEAVPGVNHFTVLRELATPASRVHQLALDLLSAA